MNAELNIYIVASNGEPTCIIAAHNKNEALRMVEEKGSERGYDNMDWEAYDINDYFSDEYFESEFIGWFLIEGQTYLQWT